MTYGPSTARDFISRFPQGNSQFSVGQIVTNHEVVVTERLNFYSVQEIISQLPWISGPSGHAWRNSSHLSVFVVMIWKMI